MTEQNGVKRSSEPTTNNVEPTTLLPCPFCGGEAFVRMLYMTYIVDAKHDDNCPLICRVLPYDAPWCTRMAAQAAWNRRAEQ